MLDAVDLPERFKAAQLLLLRQIAVRGERGEGEGGGVREWERGVRESEGGENECRSKGGREWGRGRRRE